MCIAFIEPHVLIAVEAKCSVQLLTLLSTLTPTRSATYVHTPFPPHTLTGKVENERFVRIALHQGSMKKAKVAITLETLDKIPQRDPTIMAVAFKRQRVYLLSRREPQVGLWTRGRLAGFRDGCGVQEAASVPAEQKGATGKWYCSVVRARGGVAGEKLQGRCRTRNGGGVEASHAVSLLHCYHCFVALAT